MDFKSYLKEREVGFWVSAATAVIAIITAIVYAVCYAGTNEFSVPAIVCVALCAAFALASMFAPVVCKYVPYVLILLSAMALGFYIYSIYYYVSVVLVGIDLDSFSAEFILSTILFVLLAVISSVNLFFKQGKKPAGGNV